MPLPLIALALGAALFVQISATIESSRLQKKALRAEQRQRDIETARSRVSQVREARIKRSKIVAASQAAGGAGGTGEAGAISSLRSQLGANLSFIDQTQQLSRQINIFRQQAATVQAVGTIAGNIFQIGGGFESLFKTNTAGKSN